LALTNLEQDGRTGWENRMGEQDGRTGWGPGWDKLRVDS